MIHWTPEGVGSKVGFNVYATFKAPAWFRVIWYWYDAPTRSIGGWYFRFRLGAKPHFIFNTYKNESVIESYLWERDLVVVSRKGLEDSKSC